MKRRELLKSAGAGLALTTLATAAPTFGKSSEGPTKRLYVDGLSFLPEDLGDARAAELDAFIADISAIEEVKRPDGSVNYKRTYKACMKSIQERRAKFESRPEDYLIGLKGSDIEKARENDQCAVFLQIQGADCVEGGLHQVDEFYDKGLRVQQLTHHYDNIFAGGALSLPNKGLTRKGFDLIEKLESKHMLVDLSHSSVQSAIDTLKVAKGPIVQTHGAARAIVNNARNSPDMVIKGIADSGGVFGVFMMSWWLTGEAVPRPEHYIENLKHVKNVGGIDAVGIANDYPLRGQLDALAGGNDNEKAIGTYRSWWQGVGETGVLGFDQPANHIVIPELNHIKRMRSIEYMLQQAKFTSSEIDKIMGLNWQRVLRDVVV